MAEIKFSQRIEQMASSATIDVSNKAKELKQQGIDILSFSAGEPDFTSPPQAKEAAIKALEEDFTYYTPTSGIPELKEAICQKLKRDNKIEYQPKNIFVGVGAKQVLYNAFQILLDPGDEVILPTPCWVSYEEQIKLAQGKIVFCPTDEAFKLHAESIANLITPRTKIIILNSPNNPTGAVIEEGELKKIAELAVKNNIYVISDEVYEHFIYTDKKHLSIASFGPKIKDLTLTINGLSKTYAMTGWRLGYGAGAVEIIKALDKIQAHTTSNACSFAQKGAIPALIGSQKRTQEMINTFKERRDYLYQELNKIPGIKCLPPEGAFYMFVDVSKLYNEKISGSVDFCSYLLEKIQVGIVPGVAFGKGFDDYVRISFTSSMEDIKELVKRFKKEFLT